MELIHLPMEMILQCMSYLDVNNIVRFGSVCTFTSQIYKDDKIWRQYMLENFNVKNIVCKEKTSYENYVYITRLFKPFQLETLKILKELYNWNYILLTQVCNYNECYCDSLSQFVEFNNVVIVIMYSKNTIYRYSEVRIICPSRTMMRAYHEDDRIVGKGNLRIADFAMDELAKEKQHKYGRDDDDYRHYIQFTRDHLNVIKHM